MFFQLNKVYAIWDWATKGIIHSLIFGLGSIGIRQWSLYIRNGNITIKWKVEINF